MSTTLKLYLRRSFSNEEGMFIHRQIYHVFTTQCHDRIHQRPNTHMPDRKKNTSTSCRLSFPIPPMPKTCILSPFTQEEIKQLPKSTKDISKKIEEFLSTLPQTNKMEHTFSSFLKKLDISKEDYIIAIRSSLQRTTVFLKRETNEIFINAYNAKCLEIWDLNMDIQFFLDHYAVAVYIVSYMCKGTKGLSTIMEQACKEYMPVTKH